MAPSPRPAKRRRTGSTTPATDLLPLPPVASTSNSDAPSTITHNAAADEHDAFEPSRERTKEEQEEMERIYDLVAEEYHDILSEMPIEYQRTFHLLRELEDSQQQHETGLRTALEAYIAAMQNPTAAPSPAASTSTADEPPRINGAAREQLAKLSEHATRAVRAGEDKVGLASTLYEMVDRHIRRLDADLAKYEDSLVIGLRDGTLPSHDAPAMTFKSPPGATTSLGAIALGEHEAYEGVGDGGDDGERTGRGTRRKASQTAAEKEQEREWKRRKELQKEERKQEKKVDLGMPIDPNEPTYCYCDRVSFGEMIACENEDCSREWFHLGCVGLDQAPEGAWYCDDCVRELGIDAATMQKKA
ncbi:hypothetical protein JCM3770_007052 [Rhodotorula araucariae]